MNALLPGELMIAGQRQAQRFNGDPPRMHRWVTRAAGADLKIGLPAVEGGRMQLVAVVCNIPIARNRATADFLISSPLMDRVHQPWDPAAEPGQREHARTGSGAMTRVA